MSLCIKRLTWIERNGTLLGLEEHANSQRTTESLEELDLNVQMRL